MSDKLKQCILLFFKYFENEDKEMMKLYHGLLSKHDERFIVKRLGQMMSTRNKTFKLPSISEIIAPKENAIKENVWRQLQSHLNNPYEQIPDHLFVLKEFLNIPKNKNEFEMRKIHNDFMSEKYDEFQLFLSGDVKIPHLEKKLGQYGISLKESQKQIGSTDV